MKNRRLVPAVSLLLALAGGGSFAAGCGGRNGLGTIKPDGGGAGQVSGAAGSGTGTAGASGGTVGTAGTLGTAGVSGTGVAGVNGQAGSGGQAGVNGQAGSGGAGVTGAAGQGVDAGQACGPCPPVACKDGFMSVVDPAVSCCAVCRPINCAAVDCAAPACTGDNHLETPPGKCCPVCVPGPSEACNKGRTNYQSLKSQTLDKYNASSCMVDSDCKLIFEHNACENSCGIALFAALAANFESNLENAAQGCATCPSPPLPPCAQVVAVCSNGQCTTGAPPH